MVSIPNSRIRCGDSSIITMKSTTLVKLISVITNKDLPFARRRAIDTGRALAFIGKVLL